MSDDPSGNTTEHQKRWADRGFDPHQVVHESYGCFTFEEVQRSLFGSTRLHAVPVHLADEAAKIPVVINLAKPLYLNLDIGDEEAPNWYFEGWILKSGFDTTQGFERVRIHVATLDPFQFTEDDLFSWQRITD